MVADFDPYAGRYGELVQRSIAFSGQEHLFFVEAKALRLLELVHRRLGDASRVRALDIGCGTGLLHRYLGALGELDAIDPSAASIQAAGRANPRVRYRVGTGTALPYPGGLFDLTLTVTALHHVPPGERDAFVAEMRRVTRPGGLAVVFDHNPLNPLTRLAVGRCAFDEDAVLLTQAEAARRLTAVGLDVVERAYILFFPSRRRLFRRAERALVRVPLGAQYYVAAARA